MLSLLESRHIAEESLSLQERLRRISHLDKEGVDRPSKTSIARRAKWLELAFNGSNISFQKRLAVAGLDDDDINFAQALLDFHVDCYEIFYRDNKFFLKKAYHHFFFLF